MAAIEQPIFRGYVAWYGGKDSPFNGEPHIREWLLERFLFEIVAETGIGDLRDIGESLEGRWSAYTCRSLPSRSHFFFELETDAMAFKLRWL